MRKLPNDEFYTPAWVFDLLFQSSWITGWIEATYWEPATAEGHLVRAMEAHGLKVRATGLPDDFLQMSGPAGHIITNPPYGAQGSLAANFVRHALNLTCALQGRVTMLLPFDFDAAPGRWQLFAEHPAWKAKYVLVDRIRWANLDQKKAGPKNHHAWYEWDWRHQGPARIYYLRQRRST